MPRAEGRTAKTRSGRSLERGKADKAVTAFLRLSKRVPVLVLFRDQADTLHAYEEAVRAAPVSAAERLSPRQAQNAGRTGVMRALQAVAARSRSAIAPLLKQLQAAKQCSAARHFFVINAMALEATREGVKALAGHPAVARVLIDRWVSLQPVLEGEPAPERTPGWNLTRIGAPAVWALGIDGTGVTVGTIDTGAEYAHPALQRKFRGYDPADPANPSLEGNWYDAVHGRLVPPYDDNRHGTHVTGIMVGGGPGSADPIGVAPGARWIAAKGFNERGQASSSWLLAAGEWMLAPRDSAGVPHPEWAPDVLNNAWGGGPGIDEWYRPLRSNWRSARIVALDGAGIGGAEIKPAVTAPGVSIRSAVPGGGYRSLSGSAMAAAQISGVAALLLSAQPALSAEQVEAILTATADRTASPDGPAAPNNGSGCGLANGFAAVTAARGMGATQILAYDDGGFENSDAWTADGSGWAVRMTPPPEGALLLRAAFLLMDGRWPVPGGDRFRMAIYDSDGAGGGPGRLLAEERSVIGLRNGSWTEVDLSDLGLLLQRDFYVAYLQQGDYPNVPGLTADTTAPFAERTWERDGAEWQPAEAAGGNRMIRAVVRLTGSHSLELPVTEPAPRTAAPPLQLLNLAPCGDQILTPGEPFSIRFEGEPGGTAGWVLLRFGPGGVRAVTGPMTEATPGKYEGSCTAPVGESFTSAMLVLHLQDGSGSSGSALLPARLLPS